MTPSVGYWLWCGVLASICSLRASATVPYAYVTTASESRVVAIDTASETVVQDLLLSLGFADVAVSPDEQRIYLLDTRTAAVNVVDAASGTVISRYRDTPGGQIRLSPDGTRLYSVSGSTVAIDTASGDATAVFEPGTINDIAFSRDGRRLFIAETNTTNYLGMAILDTDTGEVVRAAPDFWAKAITLSPDERIAYLVGNRAGSDQYALLAIDTRTLEVLLHVPENIGTLRQVATSPDGSVVYVSGTPKMLALDAATGAPLATAVFIRHGSFKVSPDGRRLYLVRFDLHALEIIDAASLASLATIQITGTPGSLTLSKSGQHAYVAGPDGVYIIDTTSHATVKYLPSHLRPTGIASSPDGKRLYVACSGSGTLAVIDTSTLRLSDSLQIGGTPFNLVVAPDGRRVYVTSADVVPGVVFVVDTNELRLVGRVEVPGDATGIALSPDGGTLYVASAYFDRISLIDTTILAITSEFGVHAPWDIALSTDGAFGLVGAIEGVQRFDPSNRVPPDLSRDLITPPDDLGMAVLSVVLRHDATRAYATDRYGASLYVLDPIAQTTTQKISLAAPFGNPSPGLALTPNEDVLYVANWANSVVTLIDIRENRVIRHIPVPEAPFKIAMACPGGCPLPAPSPTASPIATSTPAPCWGDCDHDNIETITEVMAAVDAALVGVDPSVCSTVDVDLSHFISIDEVIRVLIGALHGCKDAAR